MDSIKPDVAVKSLRLYAVTGAKTRNGGIVQGTSDIATHGLNSVLAGDTVTYPDGNIAFVLSDPTTRMTAAGEDGKMCTVAAVGTQASNGDEIVDAGQYSMGFFVFEDNTCMAGYLDEDEFLQLKAQGKVL